GPPPLERRPRHDAVLNGEQPEQQGVDEKRRPEAARHPAVDGLRRRQIADEGDGVEEGGGEDQIDRRAVQSCNNTTHGLAPDGCRTEPRRGSIHPSRPTDRILCVDMSVGRPSQEARANGCLCLCRGWAEVGWPSMAPL